MTLDEYYKRLVMSAAARHLDWVYPVVNRLKELRDEGYDVTPFLTEIEVPKAKPKNENLLWTDKERIRNAAWLDSGMTPAEIAEQHTERSLGALIHEIAAGRIPTKIYVYMPHPARSAAMKRKHQANGSAPVPAQPPLALPVPLDIEAELNKLMADPE
jgi:hypothetical protein